MKKCEKESILYIKDNLALWIKSRMKEFLISHGQLAIDISFIVGHPTNFDKYKDLLLEIHNNKYSKKIKQLALIGYFFAIYFYFLYFIIYSNKKYNNNFAYIFIFSIYFYIVGMGVTFANYEGSRFIHVGFIIQIIFWIKMLIIYNKYKKLNNGKIHKQKLGID